MLIFQIKRIISSEKWFHYVVTFFFFEDAKNLGRLDDTKRRKKEDGLMTLEDNPCNICYIGGIHLFTVFFQLLTWTILGNPVNTTEKSTLKFSKTAKFESNLSKTIQTSVNFCNFTELYLCSLKTYHFQIWQFY